MERSSTAWLLAFALAIVFSTQLGSASIVQSSQSRVSNSTTQSPFGTLIGTPDSDGTKDIADVASQSSIAETTFVANAHNNLNSTFVAGPEFDIIDSLARVSLSTTSATGVAPLNGNTSFTLDVFYDVTDTANRYSWAYHGPINVQSQTPGSDFDVVFNWQGDFSYSKNFQFIDTGSTDDVNLSGTLPLGIGSYHFKLICSVSADIANEANASTDVNVGMSGGALTFSAVPVPEPTSACVALVAALLLSGRKRAA
jgi:hypothetical protein